MTNLVVVCLVLVLFRSGELKAAIGIGTLAPAAALDVNAVGSAASAIIVPRDTTANRPATPVNGMIRYNTSITALEAYVNGNWFQMSVQPVGSNVNVTAIGAPASANIYSYSSVTSNYTPTFGSIAKTYDLSWPVNGADSGNSPACAQLGSSTNYITYDLGAISTIGNVYLSGDSGQRFGVTFSTDNVTYASGLGIQPSGGSYVQYIATALAPSVSARYVRVTLANSNGSTPNQTLCEIEVGP